MDQLKLITLLSGYPQLWDRNNEKFRDQEVKNVIWNKIGSELNSSGTACKDAYKALREKYIREREKMIQFNGKCNKWELLDPLCFLDPHIFRRRSSDESVIINGVQELENFALQYNQIKHDDLAQDKNSNEEFYQTLITLVRNSRPIWDRQYKDYHNKNLKEQLWQTISRALKTDVNICMLRWKALREKYIRQKQKYNEGEAKWIFLNDLSFLDNVIQYRRKHWQLDSYNATFNQTCTMTSDSETGDDQTSQPTSSTVQAEYHHQNYPTSSTHCQAEFRSDRHLISNPKPNTPDSTLDLTKPERKRSSSDFDEVINSKRDKYEEGVHERKSPEQIFGDLVASMLSTKTISEKNKAMMEIMQVLTKTN